MQSELTSASQSLRAWLHGLRAAVTHIELSGPLWRAGLGRLDDDKQQLREVAHKPHESNEPCIADQPVEYTASCTSSAARTSHAGRGRAGHASCPSRNNDELINRELEQRIRRPGLKAQGRSWPGAQSRNLFKTWLEAAVCVRRFANEPGASK